MEVFSLLSFDEMKRWVKHTSPKPRAALNQYLGSDIFHGEDDKAHIPLRCGGECPHMTFPVYGKNCKHVQVFPSISLLTLAHRIVLLCPENLSWSAFRMDLSAL
jgi:hypothetical protein